MDFLGIGPLEILFVILLALIIFGPNDVVKAARSLGRFMRKVVTSDVWRTVQQTSKGLQNLPNMLMREAGLEDQDWNELTGLKEVEQVTKDLKRYGPWTTSGSLHPSRMPNRLPAERDSAAAPPPDEAPEGIATWLGNGSTPPPTIAPPRRGTAVPAGNTGTGTSRKSAPPDAPFTEIIDDGDLSDHA